MTYQAACGPTSGDEAFFSEEDLLLLDPTHIPSHVAIVMDGNRRWARRHNVPPLMGHWKGAEVLTRVVKAASELGVRTLTVYALSTENWKRSPTEVEGLLQLFQVYLSQERENMHREGVRLNAIGDLSRLPASLQEEIALSKRVTEDCKKIDLVLAINYGGRDDLRRAVARIAHEIEQGVLDKTQISESLIGQYLDTARFPDPDLLIRTSGEMRLSNFLLWQGCYTEFDYVGTLWPDFQPHDFLASVCRWQSRNRRLGE